MSSIEEEKIIEGIVSGNQFVINGFYKSNYSYIRNYILQNSGNESDVEDVFQDALILIYQKLKYDSLEINSSVTTYFYGVCKNMWRNRLRNKRKLIVNNEFIDASEETDASIVEEIEKKEREHLYRKYFLKLGDSCRTLLSMVFEGKSAREIANDTGYTEGYARKKKFECKKTLMMMIEKDPIYQELKITSEKEKENE